MTLEYYHLVVFTIICNVNNVSKAHKCTVQIEDHFISKKLSITRSPLEPRISDFQTSMLGGQFNDTDNDNDIATPVMGFRRQLSGLADLPTVDYEGTLSDDEIVTDSDKRLNVLMIGTGEYTTGYIEGVTNKSDKAAGGEFIYIYVYLTEVYMSNSFHDLMILKIV